jgi:hypothetical protein
VLARLLFLARALAHPASELVFTHTATEQIAASDAPVGQRAALADDFEDGLDPRWIRALENGDRCDVTTEHAVSGSHSVVCRTDGTSGSKASLLLAFDPTTTLRVQLNVRFVNVPDTLLTFLQTSHTTDALNQRLVTSDLYPGPQIDVWNDRTMTFEYIPASIELDTWYQLDFRAQISSTAGAVSLVIDGQHRAALEDVDTTDLAITQLQVGIALLTLPIEQSTVYIDDVVISEE